jgi:hypothetical protein
VLGRAFAHGVAARLGQLVRTREEFNDTNANHMIVSYVTDAYDFVRCREAKDSLSDPVAGLLFDRLPVCMNGIAPGTAMTFRVSRNRLAYPVAAYADKLKKKLVNYYGFGL